MVLDSPVVSLGRDREVRGVVRLVNRDRRTQVLQFPSTRRVEAVLRDASGAIVARANEDLEDRAEEGILAVNPGERLEFGVSLPTRGLSAGRAYQLEASVVNHAGATVRGEIRTQP